MNNISKVMLTISSRSSRSSRSKSWAP